MATILHKLAGILRPSPLTTIQVQSARNKFVDFRMRKDYNKRLTVQKYGKERLRLNSLRKNGVLPPELKTVAHEEVDQLPRDSNYVRLRCRCVITSRPRGFITDFRVSRIVFRHLADYNKLAGVKRSMW